MNLVDAHFERLRSALLTGFSLNSLPDWICTHTYLRGEPFSFLDHEYQEQILRDPATEKVIRKCSQIGISELAARAAIGMPMIMPGWTTIYTLPTANFAKNFAKTRLDTIIQGSPEIRRKLNQDVDSSEVKQFGDSFLHIKGTKGASAAISVPADCLIHDELDFSDLEVVSNYQSRLTHSKWKLKWKFSTPTVEGWGISSEFETSKRHYNLVKCCHCATWFKPDYFEHVKIPGWDRKLNEVTPDNLHTIKYDQAQLLCPHCGKQPDLSPKYRNWVIENDEFTGKKHGYQISPFDAPNIITVESLIESSTKYQRYADFINFNLGLPAEDMESSFSRMELEGMFDLSGRTIEPYANVMGIDVGLTCHIMIGGLGSDGSILIQHTERVLHTDLERRKAELMQQYRVRVTVMDSMPYFDLLVRLQQNDINLWGALYSMNKSLEVFAPRLKEKEEETGRQDVKQVDISKNRGLDTLMLFVRAGGVKFADARHKDMVIAHMMDMKRIKDFDQNQEMIFQWKKSAKGNDHFHHTLLYVYVASRMLGTAQSIIIPSTFVSSFEIKEQFDRRRKSIGRPL